jgi:hypothetical protein
MPTAMAMVMALPQNVSADSTSTVVATPVPMSVRDLEDPAATEALERKVAAVFKLRAG